ncbi:hypothetical protein BT96DRAFT_930680 [Gymnopus androsaceus JB14]|uniref:Uncharacterized protein n=1 Tax=Gymnopus androsaceus JB14 TaxID=1447944 RepID=A0A6A4ISY7_9AGAR|nr:hypothetical protein BT96DRAFT_930680 [Gymnopus androsaceus JB14]
MESIITIENAEMDNIRSDTDIFMAVKPLLDVATIAELNRANREDADIDNMEKIKEVKTGPSRDNEMTILDWWKAYNNYYTFEASCYKSLENCLALYSPKRISISSSIKRIWTSSTTSGDLQGQNFANNIMSSKQNLMK